MNLYSVRVSWLADDAELYLTDSLFAALDYSIGELKQQEEFLFEGADIAGEQQDYEQAWKMFCKVRELEVLRLNVENTVNHWYYCKDPAPLYRRADNRELLVENAHRRVDDLASIGIYIDEQHHSYYFGDDQEAWQEWLQENNMDESMELDNGYRGIDAGVIIQ